MIIQYRSQGGILYLKVLRSLMGLVLTGTVTLGPENDATLLEWNYAPDPIAGESMA